jgi:acetyl esterase/lipase
MVPAKYKPLFLSREENADGMILNTESLRLIFQTYEPDVHSSDFSPFNLKDTAEVGKMPPVYIQISGKDPLRDDGIIYEKFLREHRVKTKLDVYEDLSHGEYVIGNSEATWRANCGVFNGFGWLLGKEAKTDADIAKVFSQPALACTMPEGIHLGLSIPDHLVSAK